MHKLYEYAVNAENKIKVDEETVNNVFVGTGVSDEKIISICKEVFKKSDRCLLGFDGNYCVEWNKIIPAVTAAAEKEGERPGDHAIGKGFCPLGIRLPPLCRMKGGLRLLNAEMLGADTAGKIIESMKRLDIGTDGANTAGLGIGMMLAVVDGHHHAAGNNKGIHPHRTEGSAHPLDALLHTADLRPADQHPLTDIHNTRQFFIHS